jgi:hypothetical protein
MLLTFEPVVLPPSDSFITAIELRPSDGGRSLRMVAASDRSELREIAPRSSGSGPPETYVVGLDAAAFSSGHSDETSSGGFLQLVLDPSEPPIPFDDPAVLGVMRDQFSWFLPLLGPRYVCGGPLVEDASRARGSFVAFEAAGPDEALWLAAQDPWGRIGTSRLFAYPPGVFRKGSPPPGPGVQRREPFICRPEGR